MGCSCILRQLGLSRIFNFKAIRRHKGVIKQEVRKEKIRMYVHLSPEAKQNDLTKKGKAKKRINIPIIVRQIILTISFNNFPGQKFTIELLD